MTGPQRRRRTVSRIASGPAHALARLERRLLRWLVDRARRRGEHASRDTEIDALTGLMSRRAVQRHVEAAGAPGSVLYADVDQARQGDLVFRKGGEEIVAVLPGATAEDAVIVAERFRVAVETLGIAHAGSTTAPVVTVTIGVASSSGTGTATVAELTDRAARRALDGKLRGQRNRVHPQ